MAAIYKKELRGYLTSMIGYVFIAFILLVVGIYFTAFNLTSAYPEFGVTLNGVTFIFLIITPILTMKILAEEKKQKTDQLLLTSPVAIWKIVVGKYLSMITIFLIPILIISMYPLIMKKYGEVSYTMAYTAVLGFFLLGCAYIAIGLFVSSVTESQVIAAVITFGILFLCYVSSGIQSFFSQSAFTSLLVLVVLAVMISLIVYQMTKDIMITGIIAMILTGSAIVTFMVNSTLFEGFIQKALNIFNINDYFNNFVSGIFDVTGIIYMISIISIFIFLTIQSIQKRRWS